MRVARLACCVVLICLVAGRFPASVAARSETKTTHGSYQRAGDADPIVIDHTCTDLSKIPAYWIDEAKKLTFHIAHTSHGSQIISGIEKLDTIDATYNVAVRVSDVVALPSEASALWIYDGNNLGGGDTYITPNEYWDGSYGISRTQSVADTGWFDASTWTWCGQQSGNSEATVQRYLDTVAALEAQYPAMRFVLMTGHTDGGSTTLDRNNTMVRQYAVDNDMVLFDFADIETYDPLGGGPYDNNGEGTCTWCQSFCASHPSYCTDLPSSCAHSSSPAEARLFCKLKGNAFWWMMARLAGWPGPGAALEPDFSPSEKTVIPSQVTAGDRVTFTVVIEDANAAGAEDVNLHDVLPSGMTYATGTLTATAGVIGDSGAPTLMWHQDVMATPVTTVTYAATIDANGGAPRTLTNTAAITATLAQPIERSVLVRVDWHSVYLPLVTR